MIPGNRFRVGDGFGDADAKTGFHDSNVTVTSIQESIDRVTLNKVDSDSYTNRAQRDCPFHWNTEQDFK